MSGKPIQAPLKPPGSTFYSGSEGTFKARPWAGSWNWCHCWFQQLLSGLSSGGPTNSLDPWPSCPESPGTLPGIGVVAAVIIFYLVGLVVSTRIGKIIMDRKHDILHRVPIVKTIYGVTYQATTSVSGQFRFTRAVFLEWPREGMIALGFVTGRVHRERKDVIDENEPQSMAVVYIPTVPNPTSGNLAFVMEDDLMETDLTVEDAMKVVFSGGIVLPESLSMARFPRVRADGEFIDRFMIDPK